MRLEHDFGASRRRRLDVIKIVFAAVFLWVLILLGLATLS